MGAARLPSCDAAIEPIGTDFGHRFRQPHDRTERGGCDEVGDPERREPADERHDDDDRARPRDERAHVIEPFGDVGDRDRNRAVLEFAIQHQQLRAARRRQDAIRAIGSRREDGLRRQDQTAHVTGFVDRLAAQRIDLHVRRRPGPVIEVRPVAERDEDGFGFGEAQVVVLDDLLHDLIARRVDA